MSDLINIKDRIKSSYGLFFEKLNGVNAEKHANDVLSEIKCREQLTLLSLYVGSLSGKKLLEIGSGFGVLLYVGRQEFRLETYGLEPDSEGFGSSLSFCREILRIKQIDPSIARDGVGEGLPWPDNSFDLVYSTNVLEHTQNPEKVMAESIRVLKPGGYLQCVVPNFGSFWEGHYCLFWLPYLPHFLARYYVKLWGKDPSFLKTLRFINFFTLKRIIKPYQTGGRVEIISWGEEIFKERMEKINFSAWAGLGKVKKWIKTAHRLKIIKLIALLMIFFKAHTPIILTLKKIK